MTLEQWASLAEVTAAVAVVASLLYVGVQIRQNTRSAKLAAVLAVQDGIGRLEAFIIQDPEFARLLARGRAGDELSGDERLRLVIFYRHTLRTWQSAFYHHRSLALDDSIWVPLAKGMASILQNDSGLREQLEREKFILDSSFAEFCERLVAGDLGKWQGAKGFGPTFE